MNNTHTNIHSFNNTFFTFYENRVLKKNAECTTGNDIDSLKELRKECVQNYSNLTKECKIKCYNLAEQIRGRITSPNMLNSYLGNKDFKKYVDQQNIANTIGDSAFKSNGLELRKKDVTFENGIMSINVSNENSVLRTYDGELKITAEKFGDNIRVKIIKGEKQIGDDYKDFNTVLNGKKLASIVIGNDEF